MNIPKISYYTRENNKGKTLSLRALCLKDPNTFENIFHAVRDSVDTQDLLERLRMLCYEQFEIFIDAPKHIIFKVIDFYGNTNFLSFKKKIEYSYTQEEGEKMKILKVADNQVFARKKEYLKSYFGTGDIQPATIPRKKPWMIINQPNEIPRGWVIWSPKLYTNDSGYSNLLSENGTVITEHIPEGEADYFQSCEEKDLRLMATRVVFTKAQNDGWRFKGVFVPDYEKTTSQIHVFKRIATEICVTIEDAPVMEILD